MILFFLIATMFLNANLAEVQVSTIEGNSRSGTLLGLSPADVLIREGGESISIPMTEVMAIAFGTTPDAKPESPQLVMLSDGSQIHGGSVVMTSEQLSLESSLLEKVRVDNRLVMAIRLQSENAGYRGQWDSFLQRKSDKDLLIVLKRDGSGLDYLAGVVSNISSEKTVFLLDGEAISVPSGRVYGVVFRRTERDAPQRPRAVAKSIIVLTSGGDTLFAKSVEGSNEMISVETGWTQPFSIPMSAVSSIDFSSGRIRYLSDMEPVEEQFEGVDIDGSFLTGLLDTRQQAMLFGPRRDSSLEPHSRLRLRGREFTKGLCIHSRTRISWALDRNFTSLDCQLGIDDEVAKNGLFAVSVSFRGDGKVLFEQTVKSTDEPVSLHLPVDGISTLSIVVDFGDGDSTGDWLNLADARLFISKDTQ